MSSEGKPEQLMKQQHRITYSILFKWMLIITVFPAPNTEKDSSDILLPLQSHKFFPNSHPDKKDILQNRVWKPHWFEAVSLLTNPQTAPPAVLFWRLHSKPLRGTPLAEKEHSQILPPILNIRHHRMLQKKPSTQRRTGKPLTPLAHTKIAEAAQFMSIMLVYSEAAFLLYVNNALAADPKLGTLIPYCMINFNTSK